MHSQTIITENDILSELDSSFKQIPGKYFPLKKENEFFYNFFLDLEHGYFNTASSKIHLFADEKRWAIVFEKSGYQNRKSSADIELVYIGNCIDSIKEKYEENTYISNSKYIELISYEEFEKIQNKKGTEMENFELIDESINEIEIRGKKVHFENNYKAFEKLGIIVRKFDNTKNLIGFEDILRYFNEKNPQIISATEEEIMGQIPKDLPKILTIEKFYYVSNFENILPSQQETFQIIAKVLVSRNKNLWKPKSKFNNHWSNLESGNL